MSDKRPTKKAPAEAGAAVVPVMDSPPRFAECWEWIVAGAAFDGGDAEPLAELIAVTPVPPEFRQMVSDIVRGDRKLQKRGKSNQKVPARERLKIAAHIMAIKDLVSVLASQTLSQQTETGLKLGVDSIGADKGMEPISVTRSLEAAWRETVQNSAADLGVSAETVENMVRDLRARIARWPSV